MFTLANFRNVEGGYDILCGGTLSLFARLVGFHISTPRLSFPALWFGKAAGVIVLFGSIRPSKADSLVAAASGSSGDLCTLHLCVLGMYSRCLIVITLNLFGYAVFLNIV